MCARACLSEYLRVRACVIRPHSWLIVEKELFLGYGQRMVNETNVDRKTLVGSIELLAQPFFEQTEGTRQVPIHVTEDGKPTQVISLEYGPWNEASNEGTTNMLDR